MPDTLTPPTPTMFRWPSEADWLAAAEAAGFTSTDEDGNTTLVAYTHDRAIDVVGTISRGGEWDDEGNVVEPPTTLDGWHVNYRGPLPDGWDEFAVFPKRPSRVWA